MFENPTQPICLSLQEAMRLQEIENNPLSDDDIAMFEMFEREGWNPERRRTYIIRRAVPLAAE